MKSKTVLVTALLLLSVLVITSLGQFVVNGETNQPDSPKNKHNSPVAETTDALSVASDSSLSGILIFSAADAQGVINPQSGRLNLQVTDLSALSGKSPLELQRSLQRESTGPGLLGSLWKLNWESRLLKAGSVVSLVEPTGITYFTSNAGESIYHSSSGEQLTFIGDRVLREKIDGANEIFDEEGRLLERTTSQGNTFFLTYKPDGTLERVEGPDGTFLQFISNETGQLEKVQHSSGLSVRYQYLSGELCKVEADHGPDVVYAYATGGLLSRIDHQQFGSIHFDYDQKKRVLKRRWSDGSQESFEYDDANRTVQHTDADGVVTSIHTSPDQRREEYTDGLGHKTVLEYDSNGRVTQAIGPTNQVVKLTYDELGRTTRVENEKVGSVQIGYRGESRVPAAVSGPGRIHKSFEYDDQHKLLSMSEGKHSQVQLEYDADGKLKSLNSCASCGKVDLSFHYNARGQITSVTDAEGNAWKYERDALGNILREVSPIGGITTRRYDGRGNLVSQIAPEGGARIYRYAPGGLMTSMTDAMGATTRYHYAGRQITVTDSEGRNTQYEYTPTGRLKKITAPGNRAYQFEYNAAGKLKRTLNPLGKAIEQQYDALGQLTQATDTAGGVTRYEYAASGQPSKVIAPSGLSTHYEYNAEGKLQTLTDHRGRQTRYEYTDDLQLAKVTLPTGTEISYQYNDQGQLSARLENQKLIVHYEYDLLGRVNRENYASGLERSFRYDALGNLLSRHDNGGGTDYDYDKQSRLIATRNTAGTSRRFRYDLTGNLLGITNSFGDSKRFRYTSTGKLAQVTEMNGDTASYDYDPAGNLATIHHPGGSKTHYEYDALGNPTKLTDSQGKQSVLGYDDAGRLIRRTDAKRQTTTFTYDRAGRLLQKKLHDGKVITWQYGTDGNLESVDDGEFPVHYAYDANGHLSQIEYPAIHQKLNYRYDRSGLLKEFTRSGGQTFKYEYDAHQRLTEIKLDEGKQIAFTYDTRNRPTSVTYPNGVQQSWKYNSENRPTRITHTDPAGKILSDLSYEYDAAGNLVQTIDTQKGKTRYGYDESGQLTREEPSQGPTIQYSYLPGGNRDKRITGSKQTEYEYDQGDNLLSAGQESFKTDANGNLIERKSPRGTTRYTYDSENRLVQVDLPDGKQVAFGYAPTGERIWREDSKGKTYFVTDGTNLIAELDGDLKSRSSYLHGPGIDRPLMMTHDQDQYFYLTDALQSVVRLTDTTGKVIGTNEMDAFGNLDQQVTKVPNPFAFTSREYDADLGIYYYRARHYDPQLGRFLSADPHPPSIESPASLNRFAYVLNAPTRYTDPLGLSEGLVPVDTAGPVSAASDFSTAQPVNLHPNEVPFSRVLPNTPASSPSLSSPPTASQSSSQLQPVRQTLAPRPSSLPRIPTAQATPRVPAASRLPGSRIAPRAPNVSGRPPIASNIYERYPTVPRVGEASGQYPTIRQPPPTWGQRISGAMTVLNPITIGTDFIACREEGHPLGTCLGDATIKAGTSLVIGVAVGVAAASAPAWVTAGLGAAAVVHGVHGAYTASTRLTNAIANRPARAADERLDNQRLVNTEHLSRVITALNRKLDDLTAHRQSGLTAYKTAEQEVEKARAAIQTVQQRFETIAQLNGQNQNASDACKRTGELSQVIHRDTDLAVDKSKQVEQLLDAADDRAANLKTDAQAKSTLADYNQAKSLVKEIADLVNRVQSNNDRLKKVIADANQVIESLKQIEQLANQAASQAQLFKDANNQASSQVNLAEKSFLQLQTQSAELRGQIMRLRNVFPPDYPEAMQKFVDLLRRLDAIVTVPDMDGLRARLNSVNSLAAQVAKLSTQVNNLNQAEGGLDAAGIGRCAAVEPENDKVVQAKAALAVAIARLARSAGLPDQIASATATMTNSPPKGKPADADLSGAAGAVTMIKPGGTSGSMDADLSKAAGSVTIVKPGDGEGSETKTPPAQPEGPVTMIKPKPKPVRPPKTKPPQPQPTRKVPPPEKSELKPFYAVYNVHAWANNTQKTGKIAFLVTGEVLRDFEKHKIAEPEKPYQYFRPGKYHQNLNVKTADGFTFNVPILLSYDRTSPTRPGGVNGADIGFGIDFPGFVGSMSNLKAPGAGWSYTDRAGSVIRTGSLIYDGPANWKATTLNQLRNEAQRFLRGFLDR